MCHETSLTVNTCACAHQECILLKRKLILCTFVPHRKRLFAADTYDAGSDGTEVGVGLTFKQRSDLRNVPLGQSREAPTKTMHSMSVTDGQS